MAFCICTARYGFRGRTFFPQSDPVSHHLPGNPVQCPPCSSLHSSPPDLIFSQWLFSEVRVKLCIVVSER